MCVRACCACVCVFTGEGETARDHAVACSMEFARINCFKYFLTVDSSFSLGTLFSGDCLRSLMATQASWTA